MTCVTRLVGGTLVDLSSREVVRRDLVIAGDSIVDPNVADATTRVIDCDGCLVLPGLVVAHTHAYAALATGMPGPSTAPETFREILERIWWRLDVALDDDASRASAELSALRALRAGATCIIDHHESPRSIDGSLDVVANAFRTIGVRALLTYGATDRHGPEGARAGLRESERFASRARSDPFIRGAIGLHAPFTCSRATLEGAADAAARLSAWLHFHAAEGPDDQRAALERSGMRLIPELDSLRLLGPRTILAHVVDVDEREANLLEERETWMTHQPRSNMNNGVGYASQLAHRRRVALGTDGIDQDIVRELEVAMFRARDHFGLEMAVDPVSRLSAGHRLASEVFGLGFGSLDVGAIADVVVWDYPVPTAIDATNLGSHLLFGLSFARVRDVFVAGRALIRDGVATNIDERELYARSRAASEALWARMRDA